MEARFAKIEERLARIEATLEHKADKNDITSATLKLVLWGGSSLIAAVLGLAGLMAKGFGWL